MKNLRKILLMGCAIIAFAAVAQQPDPVISSVKEAYRQAKESAKKNKGMGNEMVTTMNYTVRHQGKTTETLHFYYNTVEGTYLLSDDSDPHFCYYPLYLVTRSYNIGKQKYNEEFLFDASSQRLLYAKKQYYDENGKRFDREFYYQNGSFYEMIGPPSTESFMVESVYYEAEELRVAFDWLIRNPKE